MASRYDPDAAVEYARVFWDKACSDGFICLDKTTATRCTGKPKADPFVAVALGTKFEVKAGSHATEEVATRLGKLGSDCLDDSTHFVSCCIGRPPMPKSGPTSRSGGLILKSSRTFPKAPYGITDPATLVDALEKLGPPLVKKSSERKLPASVGKGDVIVYFRDGRPKLAAIFVTGTNIATHSVSRSPEGSVVSSAWDYLADDAAFTWSIYQLPVPVEKFAAKFGPFSDKPVLDFDASDTLDKQVKTTGENTASALRAMVPPAWSADTLAASVINLTGVPVKPLRGGYLENETYYVGSLAKLFALYAAIELRNRVRRIVDAAVTARLETKPGSGWERPIIDAIKKEWAAPVAAACPSGFPAQFPNLSAIFDFDRSDPTDRAPFRVGATPGERDLVGEFKRPTPKMTFDDWLDLAIRYSNNFAADRVITALGFAYINGALQQAGFQSSANPTTGPLFISGGYVHDWKPGVDAGRLTIRGKKHYKETTNFVGSPFEVARMLAAVRLHRAFGGDPPGKDDCDEMLTRMRHGPGISGNPSFIQKALGLPNAISDKIGIGEPPPPPHSDKEHKGAHDGAVVERTAGHGKKVEYVLVVVGGYQGEPVPFLKFIKDLDALITP
jgi:hypothetical protein